MRRAPSLRSASSSSPVQSRPLPAAEASSGPVQAPAPASAPSIAPARSAPAHADGAVPQEGPAPAPAPAHLAERARIARRGREVSPFRSSPGGEGSFGRSGPLLSAPSAPAGRSLSHSPGPLQRAPSLRILAETAAPRSPLLSGAPSSGSGPGTPSSPASLPDWRGGPPPLAFTFSPTDGSRAPSAPLPPVSVPSGPVGFGGVIAAAVASAAAAQQQHQQQQQQQAATMQASRSAPPGIGPLAPAGSGGPSALQFSLQPSDLQRSRSHSILQGAPHPTLQPMPLPALYPPGPPPLPPLGMQLQPGGPPLVRPETPVLLVPHPVDLRVRRSHSYGALPPPPSMLLGPGSGSGAPPPAPAALARFSYPEGGRTGAGPSGGYLSESEADPRRFRRQF
eukprot:tig00020849_g14640.t1